MVVTGRDERRGRGVAAGTGGRFIRADLFSSQDVRRPAGEVGAVDVLVNNAGYWELGPTSQTSEGDAARLSPDAEAVTGKPSRDLRTFLHDHAAAFRWAHGPMANVLGLVLDVRHGPVDRVRRRFRTAEFLRAAASVTPRPSDPAP